MNNDLLNYLIGQREERAKKVEEYNAAVAVLEDAKKKVEAFGDVIGLPAEIEKLDGFIASILVDGENADSAPAEQEEDGGVADEVVVTAEA